jgi:hypothetical protein
MAKKKLPARSADKQRHFQEHGRRVNARSAESK